MRIKIITFFCFFMFYFAGLSKSGILDYIISIEIKSTPVKLILNKIEEIVINPYKEKPLRKPLQGFRRVHIDSKKFVLLYKIDNDKIIFEDLAHHDEAYK